MRSPTPPPAASAPDDAHTYRLPAAIDPATLRRYFTLHAADREEVGRRRGAATTLGFAVQLCALRWRGHFLRDMAGVPAAAVEALAEQLGLLPLALEASLRGCPASEDTRLDHHERIRRHLGFVRCGPAERRRLLDHMTVTAHAAPRAATLYPLACRRLLEQRIVRPGPSTIRDTLACARESALAARLTADERGQLDRLLLPPETEDGSPASARSRLDGFRTPAPGVSATALVALTARLDELRGLGLARRPALAAAHPATRRLLAGWGYAYDAWSLRRFDPAKRHAVLLCTLEAALAEATDALVEMQDKLITRVHNRARKHRADLLHATDAAKARAVSVLEDLGVLVLDEAGVPDAELRERIFERHPREEIGLLVEGCRGLREGGPGSHLGFVGRWHTATRQYSPALLETAPFRFPPGFDLGRAVEHLRAVNREGRRKLGDAPLGFLPPRWRRHVLLPPAQPGAERMVPRSHYEAALLSTLNERIKSGDMTVGGSRRWADFDDYLIPRATWEAERMNHYAALGLPTDPEVFVAGLDRELKAVTEAVEARLAANAALSIDARQGRFKLARPKRGDGDEDEMTVRAAETPTGKLIRRRMPRADLADVLIDVDNETDFVRHLLGTGDRGGGRATGGTRRRNALAALLACGCNLGPERMAAATPGISAHEIAETADWLLTEDTLESGGDRAGEPRLAAALEPALGPRRHGVGRRQALPRAGEHPLRRLQPAAGRARRDADAPHARQLPPAPRQAGAVPAARGAVRPRRAGGARHRARPARAAHGHPRQLGGGDGRPPPARLLAGAAHRRSGRPDPLQDRPRGRLPRPRPDPDGDGQDAPHRPRVGRGGAPGRLHARAHRLSFAHPAPARLVRAPEQPAPGARRDRARAEDLLRAPLPGRRQLSAAHRTGTEQGRALARAVVLPVLRQGGRGRTFQDQVNTFSCLAVLHNAVVSWNTLRLSEAVAGLRAEGHGIPDRELARTSPLGHAHINPFGQHRFDLARMRRA